MKTEVQCERVGEVGTVILRVGTLSTHWVEPFKVVSELLGLFCSRLDKWKWGLSNAVPKPRGNIRAEKITVVIKFTFLVDGTLVITAHWTALFNTFVMGCFQWNATYYERLFSQKKKPNVLFSVFCLNPAVAPVGTGKHLYIYSFHLFSSVTAPSFHCSLCFLPNFPSELAEDQEGQMIYSGSQVSQSLEARLNQDSLWLQCTGLAYSVNHTSSSCFLSMDRIWGSL